MRPRFSTAPLITFTLAGLVAASACQSGESLDVPAATHLDVPAGAGSALPHVADAGAQAILSWVEPADSGHMLRFARWDGAQWSEPRTVAQGTGWFVNWADFPSVVPLDDRQLAAHWLQRSAEGTYAYDVVVSQSQDGGATWSPGVRPHSDGTPTEHGFVSMFPVGDDLGVVWLDGRRFAERDGAPATNEMTLRFARLSDGAPGLIAGAAAPAAAPPSFASEQLLDDRACDCCQTAIAMTARGPLVAYRDRSPGEIRDISVTRLVDGQWTEPRTVHADNWQIDACPVNGPQADALGSDAAVAWFTAANDTPRVHVAFSDDAGETFGGPIRVDGGNPVGRADVLLLDGNRALVLWLERSAEGGKVMARIVARDGSLGDPSSLAQTLAERPSGFPRMGRYGDGVLIAWTEPGDSSHVRAATLDFGDR
jgi:hypothetical protein